MINKNIMREYDIRGIYNDSLTDKDAFYTGALFSSSIDNTLPLIIARDGRNSSPNLSKALVDGILSTGRNVIDIGLVPTPVMYFAHYNIESAGGIMITGSHNPPTHNGFKFILDRHPFYGEQIKQLNDVSPTKSEVLGKIIDKSEEIYKKYCDFIISEIPSNLSMKIVWDPGNGAAAGIVKDIVSKISGKHIVINDIIDGNFPGRDPDPTKTNNLQGLIDILKAENYDLGLAFDGDADRIVAVDQKGRVLQGDILSLIFAKDIISQNSDAKVIADVKSSQVFFDEINNNGGSAIMWKTGHSLIKSKMKEIGSVFAGETSGHIFFADKYYGFDDGIYGAIRLIELLHRNNLKLCDIVDKLPKTYSTPEVKAHCVDAIKFKVIEEMKQLLRDQNREFIDIDGVRVITDKGWFLIRASNTGEYLVVRIETQSETNLELMKQEVSIFLNQFGLQAANL